MVKEAEKETKRKLVELEKRIGIIERILGIGKNDTTVQTEYPYSAILAIGLEGKIEVKYNWGRDYRQEWDEIKEEYTPRTLTGVRWSLLIKNLSNQTIQRFWYEIFVRDETGNILLHQDNFSVWSDIPPGKTLSPIPESADLKEALEKAGIDPTTDTKLTLEIVITKVKFK